MVCSAPFQTFIKQHTLNHRQDTSRQVILLTNPLNDYEWKRYSQSGEDGIIEELFRRIGATNRFFVEFGVEDGLECNTANLSFHKNWTGLLLEGDEENYKILKRNYAGRPAVKTVHERITAENIVAIFEKMNVPAEFDLLSIDIDGNDYWVWRALAAYKPRVAVIEYNAAHPPPARKVIPYDPGFVWDRTTYYGASLSSLTLLGKQLGYALLGTNKKGVNAFFIRNDELASSRFAELTPAQGFHPPDYGPYNGGHPPGDGPYLEI